MTADTNTGPGRRHNMQTERSTGPAAREYPAARTIPGRGESPRVLAVDVQPGRVVFDLVNPGTGEVKSFTMTREAWNRLVIDHITYEDDADDDQGDDDEDEDPRPIEGDGYVTLGRGGYEVSFAGNYTGPYPSRDIAIYELAARMSAVGEFPPAWLSGEHGPAVASIDAEVRAFHDAGGTGLVPLEGVEYEPGATVLYDGAGWPFVVGKDYGRLGVMVYASGDPTVKDFVTDRTRLTPYRYPDEQR